MKMLQAIQIMIFSEVLVLISHVFKKHRWKIDLLGQLKYCIPNLWALLRIVAPLLDTFPNTLWWGGYLLVSSSSLSPNDGVESLSSPYDGSAKSGYDGEDSNYSERLEKPQFFMKTSLELSAPGSDIKFVLTARGCSQKLRTVRHLLKLSLFCIPNFFFREKIMPVITQNSTELFLQTSSAALMMKSFPEQARAAGASVGFC